MLACQLCLAVITRTQKKENYSKIWSRVDRIESLIRTLYPVLRDACHRDCEEFDKVIAKRLERKMEAEGSPRHKQLSDEVRNRLRPATKTPLEVCETCLEVCDYAISLFDVGFKAAIGDSGAAASIALSGAESALYVCYLNLKDLRGDEQADSIFEKCDQLRRDLELFKGELSIRMTLLRDEGVQPGREFESVAVEAYPPLEGITKGMPLAARATAPRGIEENQIRTLLRASENLQSIDLSDEEVFDAIFGNYARGKNRDGWLKKLREFFTKHDLGAFAGRVKFLRFLKRTLDLHNYRSPGKVDDGKLLGWLQDFDDDKSEGSK